MDTHEAGKLSVFAAAGLASRKIETSRASSHGAHSSEIRRIDARGDILQQRDGRS